MQSVLEQLEVEQLSDMGQEAKPISAREFQTFQNYEKGREDRLQNRPRKERQCEAYNQGYNLKELEA